MPINTQLDQRRQEAVIYGEFGKTLYRQNETGVFGRTPQNGKESMLVSNLQKGLDPGSIISGSLVKSITMTGGFLDAGQAGVTGEGSTSSSIRFWAGDVFQDRASAPFRVDQAGNLTANSATLSGTISSGSLVTAFTAGEALTIGDALGPGVIQTQSNDVGSGSTAIGDAAARTRVGQSFQFSVATSGVGFVLPVRKVGSPTDNFIVALQADSSGAPSGTDLTSAQVRGEFLTTTFTDTEFRFAAQSFSASTSYWIVLRRSTGVDAANYYQIEGDATAASSYGSGTASLFNVGWSDQTGDVDFAVYGFENDGRVGKLSLAARLLRDYFIGFANSTVADLASVNVVYAGSPSIFTGLTANSTYFISTSTAGAITTSFPGDRDVYPAGNKRSPVLITSSTTSGIVVL